MLKGLILCACLTFACWSLNFAGTPIHLVEAVSSSLSMGDLHQEKPDILIIVFRDCKGCPITEIVVWDDDRPCISYLEYWGNSVYPNYTWTNCP